MLPGPASPPPGLCGTCAHAQVIPSDRGHRFIRCGVSDVDPRYARYPLLPVAHCQGYAAGAPELKFGPTYRQRNGT